MRFLVPIYMRRPSENLRRFEDELERDFAAVRGSLFYLRFENNVVPRRSSIGHAHGQSLFNGATVRAGVVEPSGMPKVRIVKTHGLDTKLLVSVPFKRHGDEAPNDSCDYARADYAKGHGVREQKPLRRQ